MLFCKEPTCKSLAVVGGYCLSHQLERANELYAQLNQRNDSGSRMSREITERIANESKLTQRSEAAEARSTELAAQLATVTKHRDVLIVENTELISEVERLNHVIDSVLESREKVEAQLATAQAALERVTKERDEAQEHLVYLFDHLKVWLGSRLIGEVEP